MKQKLSPNGKRLQLFPETEEEEQTFKILTKNFKWQIGDVIKLGSNRYVVTGIAHPNGKLELNLIEEQEYQKHE